MKALSCLILLAICGYFAEARAETSLDKTILELDVEEAKVCRPLLDLNNQYEAALERMHSAASGEKTVLIKKEIAGFRSDNHVEPGSIADLKRLQTIYRSKRRKVETEILPDWLPLLEKKLKKLGEIETGESEKIKLQRALDRVASDFRRYKKDEGFPIDFLGINEKVSSVVILQLTLRLTGQNPLQEIRDAIRELPDGVAFQVIDVNSMGAWYVGQEVEVSGGELDGFLTVKPESANPFVWARGWDAESRGKPTPGGRKVGYHPKSPRQPMLAAPLVISHALSREFVATHLYSDNRFELEWRWPLEMAFAMNPDLIVMIINDFPSRGEGVSHEDLSEIFEKSYRKSQCGSKVVSVGKNNMEDDAWISVLNWHLGKLKERSDGYSIDKPFK